MQLFLIVVAAVVVYAVSLYLWPFRPCSRCSGKGTSPFSNRKRFGLCKRCGGSKAVQRLGSKTVHRIVRDTITYNRKRKDK
jgi:DnaJ-class molecular chaperone